ncbi:MAG: hypothetical protein H8E34_04200 [Bacteroidetes bacterium]|nr:hypothetical protein [Bacteroidota bacterium]MBL6943237.1 hypothetical protein [Bacteroidales bacterium]
MEKESNLLLAKYLRGIARYTLLVVLVLVFIFALLSGSGDYGGGLKGILYNSPNALPWFILLIVLFVAWKWELVGGILITLIGMAAMYFFNFRGPNFFWFTFFLCLGIIIFGSFFIISWYLDRKAKNYPEVAD